MNRWASQNPERMEEIAELPLDEQNDALAEAITPRAHDKHCEQQQGSARTHGGGTTKEETTGAVT